MLGGAAALALAVIAFVVVTTPRQPAAGSAAMSTAQPPWPAEAVNLRARLESIGLPALAAEGQALHIHQHLDLYVDGRQVTIPIDIGVNRREGFISPLHTHDERGIIHVESPEVRDFTLGELFDVWGVRLDEHCIGGACDGGDRTLALYVNGVRSDTDPRKLVLAAHQEIVLAIGTTDQLPQPMPSTYEFPAGL